MIVSVIRVRHDFDVTPIAGDDLGYFFICAIPDRRCFAARPLLPLHVADFLDIDAGFVDRDLRARGRARGERFLFPLLAVPELERL